jgi:putative phage-type endonuclease
MNLILQNSPEWYAARLGKVTASRVADVIAKTKTGWGASRANYMAELVAERLTETPAEQYSNAAMQWGTENEPQARAAYEFLHDAAVADAGFILHPTISMSGASPDGFVGQDGLVEIKCPNTATHIETLLGRAVPGKYIAQMQWQMACSGRAWCDFVSYDPRMPATMQFFCQRTNRDAAVIAELEKLVVAFLAETDEKVRSLTRLYGEPPALTKAELAPA